ncbi:hypothetical protein [Clostridium diolis]
MFELVAEKGWGEEGGKIFFETNKSINNYNIDNEYFVLNLKW